MNNSNPKQLNWTDAKPLADGDAAAYSGPNAEESEWVITALMYGESIDEEPALYFVMRRQEGVPGGFGEVAEGWTLAEAKAEAQRIHAEEVAA